MPEPPLAAGERARLDAVATVGARLRLGLRLSRGGRRRSRGLARTRLAGILRDRFFRRLRHSRGSARILALAGNQRDHGADLHLVRAFGDEDLGDRAFVDRFEFHRRLVGLDFG